MEFQKTALNRAIHFNDNNDIIVQRTQDVNPILERNRILRELNDGRPCKEVQHVGRIPFAVVESWRNKYGVNVLKPSGEDAKIICWLLNKPENAYLRTWSGKL